MLRGTREQGAAPPAPAHDVSYGPARKGVERDVRREPELGVRSLAIIESKGAFSAGYRRHGGGRSVNAADEVVAEIGLQEGSGERVEGGGR